ncbi:hypothetical protein [Mycolicibacterium sediminis]|uniref:Uncharacterized protein n=1 Tax=Mycolicibacterium sediminis TaxID=1286180 RepID=A0A7I7QV29_9MYCO|nr:hypothetical protein [Mycolicibacterium sediminis]BBY30174.1 hypothetical protein MSEDJ_42700 [Mycolicibacterium sediminis]
MFATGQTGNVIVVAIDMSECEVPPALPLVLTQEVVPVPGPAIHCVEPRSASTKGGPVMSGTMEHGPRVGSS